MKFLNADFLWELTAIHNLILGLSEKIVLSSLFYSDSLMRILRLLKIYLYTFNLSIHFCTSKIIAL